MRQSRFPRAVAERLEGRTLLSATLVKDINPGGTSSYPQGFSSAQDATVFYAYDSLHGFELWRTDGTTWGTYLIKDIIPGPGSSKGSTPVTTDNGWAYFSTYDSTYGTELWTTDGSSAIRLTDIRAGSANSSPSNLTALGNSVYFTAEDPSGVPAIYRETASTSQDGKVTGWSLSQVFKGTRYTDRVGSLTVASGRLYFVYNSRLYCLGMFGPTALGPFTTFGGFAEVNGKLVFSAASGSTHVGLWTSDGTAAGTVLVKDINPGGGSMPYNLRSFNGSQLLFSADNGVNGRELWRSDGTAGGTYLVKDINPGGAGSAMGDPVIAGSAAYFSATTAAEGTELWRTDGTEAGTYLVRDARPGPASSSPTEITRVGGGVYYGATDDEHGLELWRSDGTEAGTRLAMDVAPGAAGSGLDGLFYTADGILLYVANDGEVGSEVWRQPDLIADAGGDYTVAEGGVVALDASGSLVLDPATAPTYEWDLDGDGVYGETGVGAAYGDEVGVSPSFVAGELDGPDTVEVTLRITGGGTSTATTANVHIVNTPPTATLSIASSVTGGEAVTVSLVNASDAAADEAAGLRYSFDLDGDGTFETSESASAWVTVTFVTVGPHVVRARVSDHDGGGSVYEATVDVSLPAAPSAAFTSAGAVDEGSTGAVSFARMTGVGPTTYSYDFDNDGTFEIAGSALSSATVPAAYFSDGPFIRVVRGRVTDAFGQFTDYIASITVLNVAPTIAIPAPANGSVVLGTSFFLSLSAFDPGDDQVTHWHVDWGDGQVSDGADASGQFGHTYAGTGLYTITTTATDGDGSYFEISHASVTATPPVATFAPGGLTAGESGYRFTVTYTDDLRIDPATLGDGDVEISGPAGTVRATLVSQAAADDGHGGVVALYEVTSPLGTWSWQDNGTYAVIVRPGEVSDLQGLNLSAGQIGTFPVGLPAPSAADLVPLFAAPNPKSLAPGGKYSVSVKVSNRGVKSLLTTAVTTRLYLSADDTFDITDVLLATNSQPIRLGINASKVIKMPFIGPAVSTGGKYRILAVTDATGAVAERNERNNTVASAPISVTPATVDLVTSFARKPKSSYKPGQSVAMSVKLTNVGNALASGSAGVRLYFSTDPVLDDADDVVLTKTVPLKLATKKSSVFNVQVKVPASTAGQKWYVFAVSDASAMGDHNHGNDTAKAGPFTVAKAK